MITMQEVHKSDINTVDWSSFNEYLLATGSTDKLVKLLDLRRAYQAQVPVIGCLHKHQSDVRQVKFSNFDSRYLASSGDSLVFWDISSYSQRCEVVTELKAPSEPIVIDCKSLECHAVEQCDCSEKVLLNHIGHIGNVTDFEWNQLTPWTIISASDDSEPFI